MKCSIIIPVFNASKTIRRCMDSLINQTYKDFEIVVVDDGSDDNSANIIKSYRDARIKLVQQENSGVSAARNTGIEYSVGELLFFVDSDDFVDKKLLERVVKTFLEKKCDVVFFGYTRIESKDKRIFLPPSVENSHFCNLLNLSNCDTFGYPWVKAIRREIVGKKRFNTNINLYEDELFSLDVLGEQCKIVTLQESLYFYIITKESLSFKVHQDYCILCDNVYKSWKMLCIKYSLDTNLLEQKANHFAMICKYYGLEKRVNIGKYYRMLKQTEYMKDCTVIDPFYDKIKKGNYLSINIYVKRLQIRSLLYNYKKKFT